MSLTSSLIRILFEKNTIGEIFNEGNHIPHRALKLQKVDYIYIFLSMSSINYGGPSQTKKISSAQDRVSEQDDELH